MTEPHQSPFPMQLVAVCRGKGGALQARTFANAAPESAQPPGPTLVLCGSDVVEADVQRWRHGETLVAPAAPVLELLTAAQVNDTTDPEALGSAYLDAVRDMTPRIDLLRMAHDALPRSAGAERALVAQALAAATAGGLQRRRAASRTGVEVSPHNPLTRRLQEAVMAAKEAHVAPERWRALLDECFAVIAARWPAQGAEYESRDGQLEMAHAVLVALLDRRPLIVEAGTGTGKSLAYALPAVLYSWLTGERVVVSTHTRNLQQQLVAHDFPVLWSALELASVPRPDARRGLRFAKLLGRTNYVCRTALARRVEDAFAAGGSTEVACLVLAVLRSADGSLDEVLPRVREELVRDVRSRRETCVGRRCRTEPCPVYGAREAARGADLVVVNHALLFADARSEGNVLSEYGGLVVDEAHNLERVATETLGIAVGGVQGDLLLAAARRMEAELRVFAPGPEAERARSAFTTLATQLGEVRDCMARLLDALDVHLPMAARVRSRQRYRDPDEVFGAVRDELGEAGAALSTAARGGAQLLAAIREMAIQEESAGVLELAELMLELRHEAQTALEFIVRAADDDWVYFLDFTAPGNALRQIVAAPLDVAPAIQRLLASSAGRVYTSATLLVEGDSAYFRRGVGLSADVPLLQIDSPFDYAEQCCAVQTAALGDYRDAEFVARLSTLLASLQRNVGRRTLVLLTSYTMLRALHAALRDELGPHARVLAQSFSAPRERLARQLAATPGAILLGTRSFWEGVDLPREALEILVLAKLPFEAPDEPIVEARCERMRAAGDDPFREFVLPEAVLRFRQGFGRLIRSQRDRGAVLLLDGRLETRPYGESFAASLPTRVEHRDSEEAIVEHLVAWFGRPA